MASTDAFRKHWNLHSSDTIETIDISVIHLDQVAYNGGLKNLPTKVKSFRV